MSVSEFIRKKHREVKEKGPVYAAKTGIAEAGLKALNPLVDPFTTPIWDANADIVLVLDSCRYDLWTETVDNYELPAGEAKYSVGSASPEWMSNTFAPEYKSHWTDAGYVTANAFSGKQAGRNRSEDVFPMRELDLAYLDEVWTEEWDTGSLESVEPSTLTDRAFWAWDRRQELAIDTLVVHYMQPHVPFREKPEWADGWEDEYAFGTEQNATKKSEWHKLRDGELDEDVFWYVYKDNLEFVLQEVQRWIAGTDAQILITSDHGNAMGEFAQWGHPVGVANPVVRKVPFVTQYGLGLHEPDYDLDTEPPATAGQTTESDIDEQLAALGYR